MNTKKYPHPCSRCGLCCIAQQCPVADRIHGPRPPGAICPSLIWKGTEAQCSAIALIDALLPGKGEKVIGVGLGCCMLGRVRTSNGVELPFDSLLPEVKTALAQRARSGQDGTLAPPSRRGILPESRGTT
jgi:hypothetical protein